MQNILEIDNGDTEGEHQMGMKYSISPEITCGG